MFRKLVAVAAVALLLSACNLQSAKPLFFDKDSELVLGKVGGTTETASYRDGQWVIEKEKAEISVEGNHYVVRDKTNLYLHFVRLEGPWYVVQGREEDLLTGYLLAEVKDRVAEVRPLLCQTLKEDASLAADIEFKGEDCFIRDSADPKKLFTALVKKAGEPVSRLQIIH